MQKRSWPPRHEDRQVQRDTARKRVEERRKRLAAEIARGKASSPTKAAPTSLSATQAPGPVSDKPVSRLSEATLEKAALTLFDRDDPSVPLHPEAWVHEIVDLMLKTSIDGGIHICLVWPGHPDPVPMLHGLASMARLAIKDMRGLRTLLYPAKQTAFHTFHHLLLDRDRLVEFARQVWDVEGNKTVLRPLRACDGKAELLMGLVNIEEHNPDTPYPTLSELIPNFLYEAERQDWGDYTERFLARSLTKLPLAHRREVRKTVKAHLGSPATAPDAIFGLPYGSKKKAWLQALGKGFVKNNPFELVLLDATDNMQRTSFRAVQQIPEFLAVARERFGELPGTVVLTDNPATAFSLRKRIEEELEIRSVLHVYATEYGSEGLSPAPQPNGFTPEARSLRHYGVTIVDREASGVALNMRNLAEEFVADPAMHQACLDIAFYLMQLSHLPGGYSDLGAWLEEEERPPMLSRQLTWPHRAAAMLQLLASGRAGDRTRDVEQALARAERCITDWTNATPMALRIFKEVSGIATKAKRTLGLVFTQPSYIQIAERFLKRKCEEVEVSYGSLQTRLKFIGLREFLKRPEAFSDVERFIFVGATDDLLRLLLATDFVPAHSSLFLSYRAGESYGRQLSILRSP